MEVDDRSNISSDDEQPGKDTLNTPTGGDCCTGELAAHMVKIWSVNAGRLDFDLWYEAA